MKYKQVQGIVSSIQKKYTREKSYNQLQSSFKYGPGGKLSPTKFSWIISIFDSNGKKIFLSMKGYKIYGRVEVGDKIFIHKGKTSGHFLNCKKIFNKSYGDRAFYLK